MTDLKFDFNPAPSTSGRTQIQPDTIYTKDRDYGYEPNFNHQGQPFFFSAAVAPGNYRVTVKLGDPSSATTTTIKAEMRRLMLENIKTAPGQFITRSFVVNVRTPQIPGGGQVRLKQRERETEMINWDEKLTLEFNGSNPRVSAIEIDKVDVPTIYVMGDSTVCDQPREPWNSWGQMLPRWFNDQIVVANHANSGESLRSSMGAHRLDQVVSTMKSGDWLLIQFGHNDMKEKGEGIGAFTSYKTDLKHYIAEARKRGGQVILVTSMERKAGVETPTLGDYPEAVRQTAREEGLPLIDLNAMSKMFYKALGPDLGKAFNDGTHHNNYGSYQFAKMVVEGIRENKLELAKYVVDDFAGFDPAHPDAPGEFHMTATPQPTTAPSTAPLGN